MKNFNEFCFAQVENLNVVQNGDIPLFLWFPVALQVPEDVDSPAFPLSDLIRVISIVIETSDFMSLT